MFLKWEPTLLWRSFVEGEQLWRANLLYFMRKSKITENTSGREFAQTASDCHKGFLRNEVCQPHHFIKWIPAVFRPALLVQVRFIIYIYLQILKLYYLSCLRFIKMIYFCPWKSVSTQFHLDLRHLYTFE